MTSETSITQESQSNLEKKPDYKKLYFKLSKEYDSKVKESEELSLQHQKIRTEYDSYSSKIASLLDVLSLLKELVQGLEENDGEKSNDSESPEKSTDDKAFDYDNVEEVNKRLKEIIAQRPQLKKLLTAVIENDFENTTIDLNKIKRLTSLSHFLFIDKDVGDKLIDTNKKWFDSFINQLNHQDDKFSEKKRALSEDIGAFKDTKRRKTSISK